MVENERNTKRASSANAWVSETRKQVRGLLLAGVIAAPLVFSPLLLAVGWRLLHRHGVKAEGVQWTLPWPWIVLPETVTKGRVEALKMPVMVAKPQGTIYFWSNGTPRPKLYELLKANDSRRYRLLVAETGNGESYCAIDRQKEKLAMFCQLREGEATLMMYGAQDDRASFLDTMNRAANGLHR